MAQLVSSNFPRFLFPYAPNVLKAFGDYNDQDLIFPKIFMEGDTNHEAVVRAMVGQLDILGRLQETEGVTYQDVMQEGDVTFKRRDYATALMMSERLMESIESNPEILTKLKGEELKRKANYSVEVMLHDHLNSCTSTTSNGVSLTGADGVALVSASHPTANGTQTNVIAGNPSFSEAALEAGIIMIRKMRNSKGQFIDAKVKAGIVPVDLLFEKERLLKSVNRVYTANNEINAIRSRGDISDIITSPHLTSATRFFLLTDIEGGLEVLWRKRPTLSMDNDFDTDGLKVKIKLALMSGHTDWRCIVSSSG